MHEAPKGKGSSRYNRRSRLTQHSCIRNSVGITNPLFPYNPNLTPSSNHHHSVSTPTINSDVSEYNYSQ